MSTPVASHYNRTLLLVEDQPLLALDEGRRLRQSGFRVVVVHSGEEAVERAESDDTIDLILMDFRNGVRPLRSAPPYPGKREAFS